MYLDLYNTGFTISFLSKVRTYVHEIVTSGIICIHQDYKYAHKLVNFIVFYLTFSIDYYTAMCIDVYLCYIHRVSKEGTCPYMKKLQGAWELFLVL